MANTGFKIFQNRRRLINGVPDGFVEPNTTSGGIGPYIPPVYDINSCPLPTTTTTTIPISCITPSLLSVIKDVNSNLVIAFNTNGGNPVAITVQYSYDQINWTSSTSGPISPRLITASFFNPSVIYFRLQAECGLGSGSSLFSNILSFDNSNI